MTGGRGSNRTSLPRATLVEVTKGLYPLQFLAVLGGVLLFALALAGVDAVLSEVLSASERSHDAILQVGRVVGAGGGWWALVWVIAGSAYSWLYVRVRRQLGDERERRFFTVLNLVLVLVAGGLLWYELSYVVFAPAALKNSLGSVFRAAEWLAPVMAWCGVPVGLVLADWYRQEDNAKPFTVVGLSVAVMVLALAAVGYPALIVLGALAGIIGGVPEGLLTLAGVENTVAHGCMVVGASSGFVLAGLVYVHQPIRDLWHEWRSAADSFDDSAPGTLLDFVLNGFGIAPRTWRKSVLRPALVVLGLAVAAVTVMSFTFDSVVLPLLKALYDPASGRAFERALSDHPVAPVAALTLWIVGPVIVVGIYRALSALDLSEAERRWLRRMGAAVILAGLCVPALIALISRTELVNNLAPELLVFWTNRMAALLVSLVGVGWLVCMIWRRPAGVRLDVNLPESLAAWMVSGLIVLGAALWPFWMWALAIGVAVIVVVAGTLLFKRIT